MSRTYRAGDSVEDFCRACKTDRMHTVIVTDAENRPLRVVCGYCDSEHNFRGGPRIGADEVPARAGAPASAGRAQRVEREAFPIVSERERSGPAMNLQSPEGEVDLEMLLRRIIREESGLPRSCRLKNGGVERSSSGRAMRSSRKSWPIETFFHKVVMLRNRLRTPRAARNATDLPEDVKIKLQGYISGCYGSLTSFNVLFAEEGDRSRGRAESEANGSPRQRPRGVVHLDMGEYLDRVRSPASSGSAT